MDIPGYDEWKLRGPDEPVEIGTHEGDVCNRFPEMDEDAPRNYKPRRCGGIMQYIGDDCIQCNRCCEITEERVMLTSANYIVLWSNGGPIKISELGSSDYMDPKYDKSGGCCYTERHGVSAWCAKALMFVDFHTAVVRDKVPIEDAHREFLKIKEYRTTISPDIEGAE